MRRRRSEDGATAVEYAITILVISIALIFGAVQLGPGLGDVMDDVGTAVGGGSQSGPGDDDGTPADCSSLTLEGDWMNPEADSLKNRLASAWSFSPQYMVAPDPIMPTGEPLQPGDEVMTLTGGTAAADLKQFKDCGGDIQLRIINQYDWHVTLACYDPEGQPLLDPSAYPTGTWQEFQLWKLATECANGYDSKKMTRAWDFDGATRSGNTLTFTNPALVDEWPYTAAPLDLANDQNIYNWLNGTIGGILTDLPGYTYELNAPTLVSVSYQYNFTSQIDIDCPAAADQCDGYNPRREMWWQGSQYGLRFFDYPGSYYGNSNTWPQTNR